jgi:hypothetical protein
LKFNFHDRCNALGACFYFFCIQAGKEAVGGLVKMVQPNAKISILKGFLCIDVKVHLYWAFVVTPCMEKACSQKSFSEAYVPQG